MSCLFVSCCCLLCVVWLFLCCCCCCCCSLLYLSLLYLVEPSIPSNEKPPPCHMRVAIDAARRRATFKDSPSSSDSFATIRLNLSGYELLVELVFYYCSTTVWLLFLIVFYCFIPQQRKLMGSSAQISSGVCRCGSQEQVPEEGSGRFRGVPACAGVGSGGKFHKVPESSGVKWCRLGFGGRFRKVPKGWLRKVSEGSERFRRVYSGFRRQGLEGSGEFRCGLLPCNLDRSSHVIVLIAGTTLSTWEKPLRKTAPMYSKMA